MGQLHETQYYMGYFNIGVAGDTTGGEMGSPATSSRQGFGPHLRLGHHDLLENSRIFSVGSPPSLAYFSSLSWFPKVR